MDSYENYHLPLGLLPLPPSSAHLSREYSIRRMLEIDSALRKLENERNTGTSMSIDLVSDSQPIISRSLKDILPKLSDIPETYVEVEGINKLSLYDELDQSFITINQQATSPYQSPFARDPDASTLYPDLWSESPNSIYPGVFARNAENDANSIFPDTEAGETSLSGNCP